MTHVALAFHRLSAGSPQLPPISPNPTSLPLSLPPPPSFSAALLMKAALPFLTKIRQAFLGFVRLSPLCQMSQTSGPRAVLSRLVRVWPAVSKAILGDTEGLVAFVPGPTATRSPSAASRPSPR